MTIYSWTMTSCDPKGTSILPHVSHVDVLNLPKVPFNIFDHPNVNPGLFFYILLCDFFIFLFLFLLLFICFQRTTVPLKPKPCI